MLGSDIGSLNISIVTRNATGIGKNQVFFIAGAQGRQWNHGSFVVPPHTPAFQVHNYFGVASRM